MSCTKTTRLQRPARMPREEYNLPVKVRRADLPVHPANEEPVFRRHRFAEDVFVGAFRRLYNIVVFCRRNEHFRKPAFTACVFGLEDCATYVIAGWQREIVVRW